MKYEILIIRNEQEVGRVSSVRKASRLTNVAEIFIREHLGDETASYNGYEFYEALIERKPKTGGGRPKGYKCSDETKYKMMLAAQGRAKNPATRRKLSLALSDYWNRKRNKQ